MTELAAALVPWARAFAFTQIVEAPVYRRLAGVSWGRALVPSAVTHPIVWFVFPRLAPQLGYVGMVVVAEVFAWLVEAGLLARTKPRVPVRRALVASLVANVASVALGLSSRALFGAP